jgi:CDGSH iron-sulfur domain-containing protein 3
MAELSARGDGSGPGLLAFDGQQHSNQGIFMADPVVAGKAPIAVDVEAGKTYYWCACGKSTRQPFCDGSHKGSEFSPRAYAPAQAGRVYFCACKRSIRAPLCDGTHKTLI